MTPNNTLSRLRLLRAPIYKQGLAKDALYHLGKMGTDHVWSFALLAHFCIPGVTVQPPPRYSGWDAGIQAPGTAKLRRGLNGYDYFAAKGTNLILNSLKMRIEPFPLPQIGVFMNKTKTWSGSPTKETEFYMREMKRVCQEAAQSQSIRATFLESWIPEKVGVKRAITFGGVPQKLVDPFKTLWKEIAGYLR